MRVSMMMKQFFLLLVIAVIATGCGRRGALEAPATASVVAAETDATVEETVETEKEDKPFFLDGLL